MRSLKIISCFIFVFSISCVPADPNKQVDEGTVKGEVYHSDEIGWSIEIPKGWTVTSKDKLEAMDKKGKDALERSSGTSIDTKGVKNLIGFQKDAFNNFTSTSEPFKEQFSGQYKQTTQALYDMVYKAFADQGIKADTSSGKEKIHGLDFETFYTTIYTPDGKILLHQILLSRLMNDFEFGVTICYNNEADKKIMVDAFKNSQFFKNKK